MFFSKHVLSKHLENAHQDIFTATVSINYRKKVGRLELLIFLILILTHQRAVVGIWIADQGDDKGYAREALKNLIDYALPTTVETDIL